jgi:hypothetical protein
MTAGAAALRPTSTVAVLGALAVMHVGTPGQIRNWLSGQGITLAEPRRVSQRLSYLARHDPPLAEVVAWAPSEGRGRAGVWRLTLAGRLARADSSGRLRRTLP